MLLPAVQRLSRARLAGTAATTHKQAALRAARPALPHRRNLNPSLGFGLGLELKLKLSLGLRAGAHALLSTSAVAGRPAQRLATPTAPATQKYRRLTQHQHILQRPDIYIGSTQVQPTQQWVVSAGGQLERREVRVSPGFHKIVDEILVNAADNKARDSSMTYLGVELDADSGRISIENDGAGIPIEQHHEEGGLWVPELIFGNFMTSSNYDDMEAKVTGGRNGFGAKLTNVYATSFTIDLVSNGTAYTQTFTNNMQNTAPPDIRPTTTSHAFTRITFQPDYARFGMQGLDEDALALLRRRVYDMAGSAGVRVSLNGRTLPVKGFESYVNMYLTSPAAAENGITVPAAFESVEVDGKRWEVALAPSPQGQFEQVSFVNNIATLLGGRHVDYAEKRIVDAVLSTASNKKSGNGALFRAALKANMWLFLSCQIVNPAFESQTKECLTTPASKFGSHWNPSPSFIRSLLKSDVFRRAEDDENATLRKQELRKLKKTDGSKTQRIIGIPKLEDANNAGGPKSSECTLILTEGDSAKALAVAGLTQVGRDRYGVFPLRGKILNVRAESPEKVALNPEIRAIKEILGLKHNVQYKDTSPLRYGRVMLMTDQDHDGAHIKGLLLNYFATYYPSLLEIPNFLVQFITPIIRASQGSRQINFFSMEQYDAWAKGGTHGWKIKYYKGLGTSNSTDIKSYFRDMDTHVKPFVVGGGKVWSRALDLAFNRERAEDRKTWLDQFKGHGVDLTQKTVKIEDFVNLDLVQFSLAHVKRSIPSLVDGLKPGQRKILFACFRRGLSPKDEVKVAQLGGYVSEHTAYHHGEANLNDTIVGLAQHFVGSNNMNLLMPIGQFGSRATGGQDAAAVRYIFTTLGPVARAAFPEADDALLTYLDEEGQSVEPEWYVPILPMVLVNGAEGIGTGWSTFVPNYNPIDLIANLECMLNNEPVQPMTPWYRGFRGSIRMTEENKFQSTGLVQRVKDRIDTWEIIELPVHKWTASYKTWLDNQLVAGNIKDYQEYHTEDHIRFVVHLSSDGVRALRKTGSPETFFKVISNHSTNNMVLFNAQGHITRYNSPLDILKEFFTLRLDFYRRRKAHLIRDLGAQVAQLAAQARFVEQVSRGKLQVSSRPHRELVADLIHQGFPVTAPTSQAAGKPARAGHEFDYLLNMPLRSLTQDRVKQLNSRLTEKQAAAEALAATSPEDMWRSELKALRVHWCALLRQDMEQS